MEYEKISFEEKEAVETALKAPVLAPLNPVQCRRKVSKKKKRRANRHAFDVKVIPATAGVVAPGEMAPKRRVAAYCRVSTDDEAQASSYSLQVEHYTEYISHHENWTLIKIYADAPDILGLKQNPTKRASL